MTLSLSKQLLIDIDQMPITQHDLARAGEHVLDWLACASLGKLSDAGRAYQGLLALDEGGRCTAIGGQKTSMQNAAQHNGALGNVLEMDDIHRSSILHPGPVIIPAALAVAEQMDHGDHAMHHSDSTTKAQTPAPMAQETGQATFAETGMSTAAGRFQYASGDDMIRGHDRSIHLRGNDVANDAGKSVAATRVQHALSDSSV